MTLINYAEYEQLQSFDQALVWAVVTLREANNHPNNIDLLNYVTIRPEAVDFVKWQVQLDDEGQPFLTFSMLFPLVDANPLQAQPALPLKIPTYTQFEPEAEPMTIPTTGQGFPLPPIPPEIDTLERLACWLALIGNQLGEFIGYISYLHLLQEPLPTYSIDARGLVWDKPVSYSALYAQRGYSATGATAEGAFSAFEGDNSPIRANNDYLSERVAEARDEQAAALEPPQVAPSKGYDRIDTLPICKDQDPSIKAFNKPLRELLK